MSYFSQETTQEESQQFPMKRSRTNSFSYVPQRAAAPAQKGWKKAYNKKAFTKNVKKIVQAMTETKKAFHASGDSLVKFNSGINSAGDMMQLFPNIAQGPDEGQRIGNLIRTHSLRVKGYLKLDINEDNNVTKLPSVAVRMMIVSMKTRPCYFDATGTPGTLATLLEKGQATVGFTGLLTDLYAPINTDVFTVHHDETIYLNQSFINSVGASVPSQYLAQDVSQTVKFFDIPVKCKNKLIRYDVDVGGGLFPTNFGPFLLVGYSYLDGSSPDVVDTKLGLQYDTILTYEDA